jgi:hypothetical protein
VNVWDDGYPSGGNYWSDYAGVDEKSGPGQNLTGSDGIGDTHYIIDGNNRDRYPLMIHDVAVTKVASSKTIVGQGYSIIIYVNVSNQGSYSEIFDVTVYANNTLLATFADINLLAKNSTVITFEWNTTSFPRSSYTISANITVLPDEIYTPNNKLIDGTITVTILGDVTGDFFVNIKDAALIGANWGKMVPPTPPEVDINGDGIINIKDAAIVGANWQKHA